MYRIVWLSLAAPSLCLVVRTGTTGSNAIIVIILFELDSEPVATEIITVPRARKDQKWMRIGTGKVFCDDNALNHIPIPVSRDLVDE